MWMHFLLGVSLLMVAQTPSAGAEQILAGPVYVDRPGEASVVVELPAGVTPKPSDLRLLANGEMVASAREIRPFGLSGQGLALALCVDVSGTMKGDPLADTKGALSALLASASSRPEDRFALISFADQDRIESGFDEPRENLAKAIQNLRTRGKYTRLYQALHRSLDLLVGEGLPKRRRLIVISDGKDQGSSEDASKVIAKATALGIPIDAVGRGKIEKQYVEALRALANSTHGYFVYAQPDSLSVKEALGRIYRDLLDVRSLVAYFDYKMDPTGKTAQDAKLELSRPDGVSLIANIIGTIPMNVAAPAGPAPTPEPTQPTPEPTQPTPEPTQPGPIAQPTQPSKPPPEPAPPAYHMWLPWLLLLAVVALISLLWLKSRAKKRAQKIAPTASPLISEPHVEPASDAPIKPEPEPQRRTQVGGYRFPVPGPGQPTAVLVGLNGAVEGERYPIEREVFRIGASQRSDLSIVEDEYVSENHASIRYDNGSLLIFDEGSLNGTFVNEARVSETGYALNVGDRVSIGASTLEVAQALD